VGNYAFNPCPNLKNITIKAPTPPNIGGASFPARGDLTSIKVPAGNLATYRSAQNWEWYKALMAGF